MKTGSILDRKRSGRPSIDEETVDAARVAFHRSPRKSIRVASNELAIPRSTVYKVLHKRLRLHAYKLQIVQALKPGDYPRRAAFAEEILQRIDDENDYLNSVVFSDEATFHVSGKVVSVRRVKKVYPGKSLGGGGSCPNSFLNLRCTAVGDFNLWYQRTHCAFY